MSITDVGFDLEENKKSSAVIILNWFQPILKEKAFLII